MIFRVTAWKAGKSYDVKCAGVAAAQAYCDDAKENGYMNIIAIDENGSRFTHKQIDDRCANGDF